MNKKKSDTPWDINLQLRDIVDIVIYHTKVTLWDIKSQLYYIKSHCEYTDHVVINKSQIKAQMIKIQSQLRA